MMLPGTQASGEVADDGVVDCSTVAWMDTSLTASERADALLEASTQSQIYRWLNEQAANNPEQTTWSGRSGTVEYEAQVACAPTVVDTDGPDGVRFTEGVTAFAAPIAVASSWDLDLAELKGAAQADEAYDVGKNVILGPGVASGRTVLSGRTAEYFGEDAVLAGLMAASTIVGIEDSNDPDKAVLSDLKHFIANEQETNRSSSSSNVDERTLVESYSLVSEIAITRGGTSSVMCSYNQINGTYACENADVLNTLLKDQIGFEGYVVSDFGAVHSTADALMNGLDQELNSPNYFAPAKLDAALEAGEITQERILDAAHRVVEAYIGGGLFDNPLQDEAVEDASTDEHKEIALQTALEGSVLLQNDGTLPISLGDDLTVGLFGATSSATATEGISASSVCSMKWAFGGGGTMNCEDLVAPDEAFAEAIAEAGGTLVVNDGSDLESVTADAAGVDVAIVFGYQRTGEFSDLEDLSLQGGGDELIATVAAANDQTVVVLNTGSAVEMPWLDDVSGVLEMWYPGEQFGPALVQLLTGEVSPSGHLPMTFPASLEETPTGASEAQFPGIMDSSNIRQVDYSEGMEIGYRWYEAQDVEPLFEFGYGLTYSEFEYSHLQVTPTSHKGTNEIRVKFRVTNTGDVAATEVAQVYLELPASADEPSKRLAGWASVDLEPGEHENVTVTFTAEDQEDLHLLQYWDADDDEWVTPSGTYTVTVGGSIDTVLEDTFSQK